MSELRLRHRVFGLAAGAVCLAALFLFLPDSLEQPREGWSIVLGTATEGGTYYSLGETYAEILGSYDEVSSAEAKATSGSIDNLEQLANGEMDLAFAMATAVSSASADISRKISVLARPFSDIVQVVVHDPDGEIQGLKDLEGKRIYVGRERSGTRILGQALLEKAGLTSQPGEAYNRVCDECGYLEAVERLGKGNEDADAVILVTGTPAAAVEHALSRPGNRLLSLDGEFNDVEGSFDAFATEEITIPPNLYVNQPEPVRSFAVDVLLVCRRSLPESLGYFALRALYDNPERLQLYDRDDKAQGIRVPASFDFVENVAIPLHSGARKFMRLEREKLLVASGAVGGRYYMSGKVLKAGLDDLGIPTRLTHTEGSIMNAEILDRLPDNAVAVVQYDVVLNDKRRLPLRRIATLHTERLHVFIRKERLRPEYASAYGDRPLSMSELSEAVDGPIKLCLGANESGTKPIAELVLDEYEALDVERSYSTVAAMLERLDEKAIDGGFFFGDVPSSAVTTLLESTDYKLVSLDYRNRNKIVSQRPGLSISEIAPDTYLAQGREESSILTISTPALLVAHESMDPLLVESIAAVAFNGAAHFGFEGGIEPEEGMQQYLAGVPLHSGAIRYYQEREFLPTKPSFSSTIIRATNEWLTAGWRILAIVIIGVGGYRAVLVFRRDHTCNALGRRIITIPVHASEPESVRMLLTIRREIQKRVQLRWWQFGELSRSHWQHLYDLIEDRMDDASQALTTSFVDKIRDHMKETELDKGAWLARSRAIEEQIWLSFSSGELQPEQHTMLLSLLERGSPDVVEGREL